MRPADPSTKRRVSWLPTSRLGWWALLLFGVSVVSVLSMGATAAAHDPATFDHDALLGTPAALAALCGVASAALGGCAIVRRERALLVVLTVAADLNVLAYVLGEAIRRT